jgi:hypothetical protein
MIQLTKKVCQITPKCFIRLTTGAWPAREHLNGTPLGCAPALIEIIRIGWKGLTGKNVLALWLFISDEDKR